MADSIGTKHVLMLFFPEGGRIDLQTYHTPTDIDIKMREAEQGDRWLRIETTNEMNIAVKSRFRIDQLRGWACGQFIKQNIVPPGGLQ